jgi:ankyrin repeat protein
MNSIIEVRKYNGGVIDRLSQPVKPRMNPNRRNLLVWCRNGDWPAVRNANFVILKSDLKIKDSDGNSPLYYACQSENLDLVRFLLRNGANANEKNENGNTCLHSGFMTNHLKIVQTLIGQGASLEIKNFNGKIPSSYADEDFLEEVRDSMEDSLCRVRPGSASVDKKSRLHSTWDFFG